MASYDIVSKQSRARELLESQNWPMVKEESWRRTPIHKFSLDEIFLDPLKKENGKWEGQKPTESELDSFRKDYSEILGKDQAALFIWQDEVLAQTNIPENVDIHLLKFSSFVKNELNGHEDLFVRYFQPYFSKIINEDFNRFLALQKSTAPAVLTIRIEAEKKIEKAIHIYHLMASDQKLAFPQTVIYADKFSQAEIVEHYVSLPGKNEVEGFRGLISTTEFFGDDSSKVNYYAIQDLSRKTMSFHHLGADLADQSSFDSGIGQLGSRLSKWFASVKLGGDSSHSRLHGLALVQGQQHLDLEAKQQHIGPNSISELVYKSAVTGKAVFNFSGLLRMEKEAVNSDANQTNKNIVLSPKAKAHTAPKLEILVDEVKCAHGATVGDVDPEALFYLKSRGVNHKDAERLIVQGFLEDVVHKTPIQDIKDILVALINTALDQEGF